MRSRRIQWNGCRVHDAASGLWSGSSITGGLRRGAVVCYRVLERQRWGDHVVSPYDPDSKVYKCKGNRYKCKNTGKYFNVRTNTIFENTKVSLRKWMLACYIVINAKKGVSSVQLAKFINVTQKTAWFMLQRIQNCFV